MKRKVFLALALFALMAVGLYAQTEADFTVSKSSDGKSVSITKYNGKATAVNIPAKIQNLPVTSVSGFMGNTSITGVTIPNGVTTIGNQAFGLCEKLTNVIIPSSVTKIGIGAFADCTSLISVTFSGSIPSSGFNDDAFDGIGDIRNKYLAAGGGAGTYTRPDGKSTTWTKGGSTATTPVAAGTSGLAYKLTSDGKGYSVSKGTLGPGSSTNVVIPATYNNLPVTAVANTGFMDCAMIPSVTIPASVTTIEIAAFANCIRLNSVTFGGANTSFGASEFPSGNDLRTKYKAGGAGTYTLSNDGKTWTKK